MVATTADAHEVPAVRSARPDAPRAPLPRPHPPQPDAPQPHPALPALPAPFTLLLALIRGTLAPETLPARQWEIAIRIGRNANLLGALARAIERDHGLEAVPPGPRAHLQGARMLSRRQALAVRWEIDRIADALRECGERVVLLKGAAYVAAGLDFADGRMFSDVDVLVPLARIDAVEQALALHGWVTTHHSAYDQRYYRVWMHELPPMQHLQRGTVIDVHHRILPRTARQDPDPARMLAAAVPAATVPGAWVRCAEDMVLHSATHLFHEGELENGARDLLDIDRLLAAFGARPGFWSRLCERAVELELQRPLFLALRCASRQLGTAVPAEVADRLGITRRGGLRDLALDRLYAHGLVPHHPMVDRRGAGPARWLLYVRAHWLRMPPWLLARHLARKAFVSRLGLDDHPPAREAAR